ncbi:MAG: glycosyltransferase family 1 protein [Bacteroidia bacterium]
MIIAVNARMLVKNKMEGIGYFTYESMIRITKRHSEHKFIFIFDRPYDSSFLFSDNITPLVVSPPARHPLLWYLWYEQSLPGVFKKIKADLFISTDGYLSLRSRQKTLAVIHDINFEHYPKDLPFFNRIYYRHYFPLYAKEAQRIATVSEYSRTDISKTYHVPESKIDVVYNGAGENFAPVSANEAESIRRKFSNGKPFFLFIGALHQRKNIANLLRAFDLFRSQVTEDYHLLLAGSKRWWTEEMENVLMNMNARNAVIFTGRLSDEDLQKVTGAAFALTYVSNFEGFGIPIIEAFRCDVPVITSNITSMPEIAGDAAILVDPFSEQSIAEGMIKMYASKELRDSLIEKGRIRREAFSWDKTAEALWSSVEKTISC